MSPNEKRKYDEGLMGGDDEDLTVEDCNILGASEAAHSLLLQYCMAQQDGDMDIPPHNEAVPVDALEVF